MEFDNNTPVSDEQRKLAETKRITLSPVHSDISPEARPDSEIVAHHLVEPPTPNASNDTEQTASLIEPSNSLRTLPPAHSSSHKKTSLILGVIGGALFLLVTATLYMSAK